MSYIPRKVLCKVSRDIYRKVLSKISRDIFRKVLSKVSRDKTWRVLKHYLGSRISQNILCVEYRIIFSGILFSIFYTNFILVFENLQLYFYRVYLQDHTQ